MMPPTERRGAARYNPACELAHLGWWEGQQFHELTARLRNISVAGAMVAVGRNPPTSGGVWICLVGQDISAWVQANIAGVMSGDEGTHLVRLAFLDVCPYGVFKSVAWGDKGGQSARPTPGPTAPPAAPVLPMPGRTQPISSRKANTYPSRMTRPIPGGLSPPSGVPTLVETQLAQRVQHNRFASLPWLAAFAISMALASLLWVFAAQLLGDLQRVWRVLGL